MMRMGLAGGDVKNSVSRYAGGLVILRFFIFVTIGSLTIVSSIFAGRSAPPWEILKPLWDLRLMRNHAPYLVEGKGGLGLLLGETEQRVTQIWGKPDRRDYFMPERLYYTTQTFFGSYLLYRGRVIGIRYNTRKKLPESLQWQTALGLRQEMLKGKTRDKAMDFIMNFYTTDGQPQPAHLRADNQLSIYSRGIRFQFFRNRVRYIDIFFPRRPPEWSR